MRGFPSPEAHFDFDFVSLFEEPSRRPHPYLKVVIVCTRSQTDFLDFRDMLVLLGLSGAFVLLELEFAQIGDATDGWIGRGRDFDQVQACLFGAADCVFDWHHANLLALRVDNPYL